MTEPRDAYSPERRTALVLSGSGVDGAYHAGVLRALHEAGVKVDIVGGRGIGALAAVLAAVDGGAGLWEPDGLWRQRRLAAFYRWRWPLRLLRLVLIGLAAVLAAPLVVVAAGALVYPIALALAMAGLDAGARWFEGVLAAIALAFSPGALPTWIPRAATLLAGAGLTALAVGAWLSWLGAPLHRRGAGSRAWALLGAPVDGRVAIEAGVEAIWRLLKGGATIKTPDEGELSRRYAELLGENLGHPGFRELLVVVHDLDARRDLVFGLLGEPYRRALFPPPASASPRRAEAHDLSAGPQAFTIDALAGALTLPGVMAPRLVRFAADAYWRGETHRLCDRPAALGRLIEEAAAAGAVQAIVVSAAPEPPGPHALTPPRLDGLGLVGGHLAASEGAALADAVRHLAHRFQGLYVIRPGHNPLSALDLDGAYDPGSDRVQTVAELMARGYEDAYRQFIEPHVGASGELIAGHH